MSVGALPWAALLALGAVHGINPGMGWLFAVARGMQERSARAVVGTLLPLALGHALAIGAAVGLGVLIGAFVPPELLRWGVAATLVGFGTYRLVRGRHPRYGGMRMGVRDLTLWSFLMASSHGAGLMVLPFVLPGAGGVASLHAHAHDPVATTTTVAAGSATLTGAAVTVLHTGGYLLVTAGVALLVYRVLGLYLLRSAWINLDRIWGVALILTGALTPLL